jgi:hypothetical protein
MSKVMAIGQMVIDRVTLNSALLPQAPPVIRKGMTIVERSIATGSPAVSTENPGLSALQ